MVSLKCKELNYCHGICEVTLIQCIINPLSSHYLLHASISTVGIYHEYHDVCYFLNYNTVSVFVSKSLHVS